MKLLLNWFDSTVCALGKNHYWFRASWTIGRLVINWLLAPFRVLLFLTVDIVGSILLSLIDTKEYFLNTTYSGKDLVRLLRSMKDQQ